MISEDSVTPEFLRVLLCFTVKNIINKHKNSDNDSLF